MIRERKAAALADIAADLAADQKVCPHNEVGHWDGFSDTSAMFPHRICLECGLEEEGGWWYDLNCSHWHAKDHIQDGKIIPPKLGPKEGRVFKKMSFDELMQQRP
jgi:hypothetical protein